MPHVVRLYKYDLSGGMARQMSQGMLGFHLEGVWHTSVVVYGREFFFDGGVGIANAAPGETRFGRPLETVDAGETELEPADFLAWVKDVSAKFGPGDYNLLERNCNHFSDDALDFLTGTGVSEDVRTMIPRVLATPLGQMLRPSLEMQMGGQQSAPGAAPAPARGPSDEARTQRLSTAVAALSEYEDAKLALEAIDSLLGALESIALGHPPALAAAVERVAPAKDIADVLGLGTPASRASQQVFDYATGLLASARSSIAELVAALDASTQ
jgi:mannosyl-glycoprotein endo-beta-N-acetylglucosaminidase